MNLLVTHHRPVVDAASRIVCMNDARVVDDGTSPTPTG
jgi:ABC-type bacteriocin/lantibiotic exporter with double-glycine peptidase domain